MPCPSNLYEMGTVNCEFRWSMSIFLLDFGFYSIFGTPSDAIAYLKRFYLTLFSQFFPFEFLNPIAKIVSAILASMAVV